MTILSAYFYIKGAHRRNAVKQLLYVASFLVMAFLSECSYKVRLSGTVQNTAIEIPCLNKLASSNKYRHLIYCTMSVRALKPRLHCQQMFNTNTYICNTTFSYKCSRSWKHVLTCCFVLWYSISYLGRASTTVYFLLTVNNTTEFSINLYFILYNALLLMLVFHVTN